MTPRIVIAALRLHRLASSPVPGTMFWSNSIGDVLVSPGCTRFVGNQGRLQPKCAPSPRREKMRDTGKMFKFARMQSLLPILMVLVTIHSILLIWTNQWRIQKLIKFVDAFKKQGLLEQPDYDFLHDRYTSFLSYLEFFPDEQDYGQLYKNKEFSQFVTTTRKRLKYYAIVTVICFTLLAVLIPMSDLG